MLHAPINSGMLCCIVLRRQPQILLAQGAILDRWILAMPSSSKRIHNVLPDTKIHKANNVRKWSAACVAASRGPLLSLQRMKGCKHGNPGSAKNLKTKLPKKALLIVFCTVPLDTGCTGPKDGTQSWVYSGILRQAVAARLGALETF